MIVSEEGPTMKAGWDMSNLRSAGTASTASPPSSALAATSFSPMTPPWLFTSQTAAASPWVAQLDKKAFVPVKGSNWPNVMVPALDLADAPAGSERAAMVATLRQAATAERLTRLGILVKVLHPLFVKGRLPFRRPRLPRFNLHTQLPCRGRSMRGPRPPLRR